MHADRVDIFAVRDTVERIVSEVYYLEKSEITRSTPIRLSRADPASVMIAAIEGAFEGFELICRFEEEFNIQIPDEAVETIGTVGGAIDLLIGVMSSRTHG